MSTDACNNEFFLDWTMIRRVFIQARQQFGIQMENIDLSHPDMNIVEVGSLSRLLTLKQSRQLGCLSS